MTGEAFGTATTSHLCALMSYTGSDQKHDFFICLTAFNSRSMFLETPVGVVFYGIRVHGHTSDREGSPRGTSWLFPRAFPGRFRLHVVVYPICIAFYH